MKPGKALTDTCAQDNTICQQLIGDFDPVQRQTFNMVRKLGMQQGLCPIDRITKPPAESLAAIADYGGYAET